MAPHTFSNIIWWPCVSRLFSLSHCIFYCTLCWHYMPFAWRIFSPKFWISPAPAPSSCNTIISIVNSNNSTSYCFSIPCPLTTLIWNHPRHHWPNTRPCQYVYPSDPSPWFDPSTQKWQYASFSQSAPPFLASVLPSIMQWHTSEALLNASQWFHGSVLILPK